MGSDGGAPGGGALTRDALTAGALTGGALTRDALTAGALGGGALTGGALTRCALTGGALTAGAPTGGGFTRGADCVDRDSAGSGSVGSLAFGRSTSSVTNRLTKKPVSAKTTSAGVSIFWADASGARLLEPGGRFLDMGNG
jgi:hypothetical protein